MITFDTLLRPDNSHLPQHGHTQWQGFLNLFWVTMKLLINKTTKKLKIGDVSANGTRENLENYIFTPLSH